MSISRDNQRPLSNAQFLDFLRGLLEKFRSFRRYQITLEGFAAIGLMVLVGFAAWHSGTNLLYLIFTMLVSLFVLHGLAVGMLLRSLELSRRLPPSITALAETQITLTIRNQRRWLSSYALRLTDHTKRGEAIGTAFALKVPPGDKVQTTYRTVFPRRGRFQLRRLEITSRFPFGLVERGFSIITPQEVLVYPAMYQVEEVLSALKAETGEIEAQKKGDGYDYYGLREYAPGDPARLIHWRSSVRVQRLVVVEHEQEERRQITLLLPNMVPSASQVTPQVSEAFETAVSLAASLARYFLDQGYEVQLITASGTTPHGTGQTQLHRILKILAELELRPTARGIAGSARHSSAIQINFQDTPRTFSELILDARDWNIQDNSFRARSPRT